MKVVISGGGTAGHINPGIAIANEIKSNNPDAEIIFIGTEKGLEKELVPKAGYELKLITVRGLKRKLSIDTLRFVKDLAKGIFQARRILKKFKPDIVIGTGGYVCGPVLINASLMGFPTLIHEQNVFPGLTNKLLSRYVDAVAISFDESKKFFSRAKSICLTGNPIRHEIINSDRKSAREKLGIEGDEKLLFCFGGSGGAEKINETVVNYIKEGLAPNIKLIFGTGSRFYDSVMEDINTSVKLSDNVQILPYIHNMDEVMAAADLILCRAGAITLSEITAIGACSILIPSPNVTNNHQEYNARALHNEGAAVMLLEKDLKNANFKELVEKIINDEKKLKLMAQKSKAMGKIDAVKEIYKIVKKLSKAH